MIFLNRHIKEAQLGSNAGSVCIATAWLLFPPNGSCQHIAQAPAEQTSSPNIILILTDDQGMDDVGFCGNPILHTPRLDDLAAQSTQLTRFYTSPVCSPTRASLMTGRYHFRTGVIDTADGRSNIRAEETTIAAFLHERDYRTGIFGKWHLGDNAPSRPMDKGFDESIVLVGGMLGAAYNPLGGASYFDPILVQNGTEKRFIGYITDILTDQALDFIERHQKQPFFLYLAYNAPHHPLSAPERYIAPYRNRGLSDETSRFYGMISNVDHNVGRLLDQLDALSLTQNTIVIFMSDNGTSSLLMANDRYQSGLRGRKTSVYENGIRVPFCIRWPNHIEAGRKLDTLAAHIDILPTLLDACGAVAPVQCKTQASLDGVSLWPLLAGHIDKMPARKLFLQWHRGDRPILFRNATVVTDKYKLVQPVGRKPSEESEPTRFELYNLADDMFEQKNISTKHTDIANSLKNDLQAWFASMGLSESHSNDYKLSIPIAGTLYENPLHLTRQDWHGAVDLNDTAQGSWLLDIKRDGHYEVTLRFSDILSQDGTAHLMMDDQKMAGTMTMAESAIRFSPIPIKAGIRTLIGWVTTQSGRHSARYADVRCIDLPDSIKPYGKETN